MSSDGMDWHPVALEHRWNDAGSIANEYMQTFPRDFGSVCLLARFRGVTALQAQH